MRGLIVNSEPCYLNESRENCCLRKIGTVEHEHLYVHAMDRAMKTGRKFCKCGQRRFDPNTSECFQFTRPDLSDDVFDRIEYYYNQFGKGKVTKKKVIGYGMVKKRVVKIYKFPNKTGKRRYNGKLYKGRVYKKKSSKGKFRFGMNMDQAGSGDCNAADCPVEGNIIRLTIRTFSRQIEITINKNQTLQHLKEEIMEEMRQNSNSEIPGVILTYGGHELEGNHKTLSELGLEDDDRLEVEVKPCADNENIVILVRPNGQHIEVKINDQSRPIDLKRAIMARWNDIPQTRLRLMLNDETEITGNKLLRKFGFKYKPVIYFSDSKQIKRNSILARILRALSDDELMTFDQVVERAMQSPDPRDHLTHYQRVGYSNVRLDDYDIIQLGFKKGVEMGLILKVKNPQEKRKWKGHFYTRQSSLRL